MGDSSFKQAVYRVVRQVPRGRVISYGAVADLAGHPGAARAVGAALRALPDEAGLPWWRVVNGRGEVSTSRLRHTAQIQRALLEEEAVEFDPAGRISWGRFGWKRDGEDDPDP